MIQTWLTVAHTFSAFVLRVVTDTEMFGIFVDFQFMAVYNYGLLVLCLQPIKNRILRTFMSTSILYFACTLY